MGITAGNTSAPVHLAYLGTVTGTSASTGVIFSTANPFGCSVLVHELYIDITTQSTGASTLDAGIAADATTGSDTLIDGVSGASVLRATVLKNGGTNGRNGVVWSSSRFLNVEEKTGDVDGMVAKFYVLYSVVPQ
jgi:hypothetical protein